MRILPRIASGHKMRLNVLHVVLLFQSILVSGREVNAGMRLAAATTRMGNDTFLYFAYGSNLLGKRIHLQNPTAERRGIGRLKVSSIYCAVITGYSDSERCSRFCIIYYRVGHSEKERARVQGSERVDSPSAIVLKESENAIDLSTFSTMAGSLAAIPI